MQREVTEQTELQTEKNIEVERGYNKEYSVKYAYTYFRGNER